MPTHSQLAYSYLACFVAFVLLRGAFAIGKSKIEMPQPQLESRASHLFRVVVIVAQTGLMACYGFRTMFGLFLWMDAVALPLPAGVRFSALLFSLMALLGIVWVHATLGRLFSDRLTLQDGHQLVTTGPYHWVRHPMYSFLFLFFISSAVLAANALIAACSLLLVGNIAVRIAREEAMLRAHFGTVFEEYAARTPRLIPGLARVTASSRR